MDHIESLRQTIRNLHGCNSEHLESIPVTEIFQGETVWDGVVEVFAIEGHLKAKKCYAWAYTEEDGKIHYVAVLELPPVVSPQTAVKAAIVNQIKQG
jgi:hypothetical protein